MNNSAIKLLRNSEGCRLAPYRDSVGVPTIGYGNTFYANGTPVKMSDASISQDTAELLFTKVYTNFENHLKPLFTVNLNSNQFGACVNLAYNIGIKAFAKSTLLKLINESPNDFQVLEPHFLEWKNAGGKPILLNRRIIEFNFYKKPSLNIIILIPLLLVFYTVFTLSL